ncbi:hypothetical protein BT63DRAFT_418407 [Microthyrium microscopicum]|uniref:Uncharacterized protein n=1 Tax=Microthyrium microscopicum TaxID=703497 RepID=A0A6A6TW11_9PEZI|nr:hypothetical protein BT63DRAFT_418407 [Microthyrium microscopicum]
MHLSLLLPLCGIAVAAIEAGQVQARQLTGWPKSQSSPAAIRRRDETETVTVDADGWTWRTKPTPTITQTYTMGQDGRPTRSEPSWGSTSTPTSTRSIITLSSSASSEMPVVTSTLYMEFTRTGKPTDWEKFSPSTTWRVHATTVYVEN